jgi:NADH-quinone oxidoreductase subunit G
LSRAPERLTTPLVATPQGKLEPATWEHALRLAAGKLKEVRDSKGGAAIGVIGSNHTTNEENYLLQKFARTVLGTNNIDHERTTDYAAFARALAGHKGKTASLRDIAQAPAILLVGGDPTNEHPLLAWNVRTNVRLNRARLYIANSKPIKLERQAKATQGLPAERLQGSAASSTSGTPNFSKAVMAEESLVVIFGQEFRGGRRSLVAWGLKRGNVRFAYLGDHANSRGAADMGLFPDLLPGYVPVTDSRRICRVSGPAATPGKTLPNVRCGRQGRTGRTAHRWRQSGGKLGGSRNFLQEHIRHCAGHLPHRDRGPGRRGVPRASLYEKSGTVTNTFGDVQLVKKAADRAGVKPDFEILVRLAGAMGVDVKALVPFGKGRRHGRSWPVARRAGRRGRPHAVWLAANNLEPGSAPSIRLQCWTKLPGWFPATNWTAQSLHGNDVRTRARLRAGLGSDRGPGDLWFPRTIPVYLRNAGPLQPRAQGTQTASGARTGRIRGRLAA